MQHVTRIVLSALIAKGMTGATWAMEDVPHSDVQGAAEYKRADTNFYGKGDVVRAHPTAVILAPGGMTQTGDSYFFTTPRKAPKSVYLEMLSDWIEPITPPDMPASLGVPPDVMQIREPQGDVQVALPSAPANFTPVTDGMSLPNGAVLKTGANGTAAVLFGGVDSARLIPNSEAAVQQTVTAQSRSAEVDLTTGAVFSKVGTQVGVKGQYDVHTPYGNASAEGGDFVTVISDSRTDVWVAQGTVELNETDGKKGPVVSSDGVGPLKIMRLPAIANAHLSFLADTESLTTVLNFIPLADQKIKALRDKLAGGATLTPNEQAYLARIKKVPCVVKLALVEPPAPAPAIAPIVTAPPIAPVPSQPGPIIPVTIDLQADGSVAINGAPTDLNGLKSRLADIAKANPTQPLLITGREKVKHDQLKKVIAICHEAKLKVKVAKAEPMAVLPQPVVNQPTPAIAPLAPAPTIAPAPPAAPTPAQPPVAETVGTPAAPVVNVPASPARDATNATKPISLRVRTDGKINFQLVTYTPSQLKPKLEAIAKTTPDQSFVIKAGRKVPYADVQQVLGVFHDAGLQNVTFLPPPGYSTSQAPATPEHPADNLPAPGLLMHPSMQLPPTPTTENSTTNSPPAPGP